MKKTKSYKLSRNLQTCQGLESCGKCVEKFPPLGENKPIRISATMLKRHELKIDQAIMACPTGALEVK